VLVDGRDKTGQRLTGRTRGNRVTVFDGPPELIGSLVPLRITRASVSTLYGEVEPAATLVSSASHPVT
jgi:tRNA-2-methylthio-N6-dimethylallyladenosine synthase